MTHKKLKKDLEKESKRTLKGQEMRHVWDSKIFESRLEKDSKGPKRTENWLVGDWKRPRKGLKEDFFETLKICESRLGKDLKIDSKWAMN